METTFGLTQLIASGSPKNTCISTLQSGSSCQFFEQRGTFVDITRVPGDYQPLLPTDPNNPNHLPQCLTCGNWVEGAIHHDARTPIYSQTDLNFAHELKVSKTNELMRLRFEWNVLNVFNQDSVLQYQPNPTLGGQNITIKDPTNQTGIDFKTMMTGWDPIAAANANGVYNVGAPLTLANRYSMPFLFQTRRTMRMGIRFSF